MRTTRRLLLSLTAVTIGMCMVCAPGFAKEPGSDSTIDKTVVSFKAPQLKDWQNAAENERYAFLIGVVAMFEAEREWQSPKMLPVKQSTIGVWNKGLTGVTFRDMHDAIDAYIKAHPEAMDEQVLMVLGRIYVAPVMTDAERTQAKARYTQIQKSAQR